MISGMTVVMSFPRKRESRKYFCYSGLDTESRRYLILLTLKKKKRIWIPNQVGDDRGVVFGDDKLLLIPDKRFQE